MLADNLHKTLYTYCTGMRSAKLPQCSLHIAQHRARECEHSIHKGFVTSSAYASYFHPQAHVCSQPRVVSASSVLSLFLPGLLGYVTWKNEAESDQLSASMQL